MNSPPTSQSTVVCGSAAQFTIRGSWGLYFALTLSACGGPGFASTRDDVPLAGAAGDVDPGSGGSSAGGAGESGASQGGDAPGGSSAQAGRGSGGAAAGSGSGTAGSGATGTGGEPAGGTGGAPTVPSCTAEEAITLAAIPESFTWGGFSLRWDDVDQSYCGHSDGGTCTLRNLALSFSGTAAIVGIDANFDCTTQFYSGICGAEAACTGSFSQSRLGSYSFDVVPEGDGYRIAAGRGRWVYFDTRSCDLTIDDAGTGWSYSGDPELDFDREFNAVLERSYPCP